MPSVAGKSSTVAAATTGAGTYNILLGVKSFTHSIDGATLDDSEMGVAWVQRIQGLKDGKLSISGSYRSDDTTGQLRCRDAMLNDTELHYRVLYNGVAGYRQQCRCSKFQVDASVEDKVNVSIELEGTGAITAV